MPEKSSNSKRQLLFKVIAVTLPFMAVIFLEVLLRLFHCGYTTSLFIADSARPGYFHNNRNVNYRIFTDRIDAPASYEQSFKKEKSPDTYRIFVLGESSALGFPYNHRGSFPRMLQYWLEKSYPDRNIEVINLSATAINSYALLSYTDEIIPMQPDAILIYTGHNEYYGALGVGSRHRMGLNRGMVNLVITLKKFRIMQMGFQWYANLKRLFFARDPQKENGLMRKMAGDQQIVYNSGIYNRGLQQFKDNMTVLLHKYQSHHIPVFISNIVSNERGQKPFISVLHADTDTTLFMQDFRKGYKAWIDRDYDTALKRFSDAGNIDSTYAINDFLMGEILFKNGNYREAKRFFADAKELDALRFRAPEKINAIIRNFSLHDNNIHFVDAKQVFEQHSPGSILGDELFTDHLHPNLAGNFLIAGAFYQALKTNANLGTPDSTITANRVRKEMPVTEVDSINGELLIRFMKEKWPFYETSKDTTSTKKFTGELALDLFHKQISWDKVMDSLYKFYMKNDNITGAIRVAKAYDLDNPEQTFTTAEIARLYVKIGDYDDALFYYKKAFRKKESIELARKIVINLLQMDRPEESRNYLNYMIEKDPNDKTSISLRKMINGVLAARIRLVNDPGDSFSNNILANYYLFTGNLGMAKKFIDQAMKMNNRDKETLQLAAGYNEKIKDLEHKKK
jgi:tetratricopeptide (TPR) repeat protein